MQKIKSFIPYIVSIAIGISIAMIFKSIYHPLLIQGSSMEPTYQSGDIVRCTTKLSQETLKRGDIIVFKPGIKQYVKRIIALPGETIEIIDGYIYVNGKKLPEYQFEIIEDAGILTNGGMTLNANEYFCLGDNRNNSRDCRILGPAQFEQIKYLIIGNLYKKGET